MQESQESDGDQELLAELRKVGSDLGFRRRIRRIIRGMIALMVVDMFVSILAIYAVSVVRGYQHDACERSNKFREAYVNQWAPIIADSPIPTKPPDDAPQAVKDAYRIQIKSRNSFIHSLNTDFAQQPC